MDAGTLKGARAVIEKATGESIEDALEKRIADREVWHAPVPDAAPSAEAPEEIAVTGYEMVEESVVQESGMSEPLAETERLAFALSGLMIILGPMLFGGFARVLTTTSIMSSLPSSA